MNTEIQLNLREIEQSKNVDSLLSVEQSDEIGREVVKAYDEDKQSRQEWEKRTENAIKLALQMVEAKSFPWQGACYSLDTDILTESGWKPIGDVQIGEKVYSRDAIGRAGYYPVTNTFKHVADKVVHFLGKSVDLMVTTNHQMYVQNRRGKVDFIQAGVLLDRLKAAWKIPLTSTYDGHKPQSIHGIPSVPYARLLGWFISEGSCFKARNTYLRKRQGGFVDYGLSTSSFGFAQSKDANPKKYEILRRDIENCGFSYSAKSWGFIVHARSMPQAAKDELRGLGTAENKHIPRHILALDSSILVELLDSLILGDGNTSKRNGHRCYYTVSRRLADDIQELCQKIGLRGTVAMRTARPGGSIRGRLISGARDGYEIKVNRKPLCQLGKLQRSLVEWNKEVACVEVAPHHVVYVRRNGKATWCGNSNVKFPLVTIAALQFSARAYPALVKVPDLVHYRVMGEDKNGQKASRASRIGRHMSWQLLDQDENWEEDTDKKFITVPIVGCAFKKTYWDAGKELNCSRLVFPQNLVVHYYTRTIEECERKTEIFELYKREIREKQLRGLYSGKELSHPQQGVQKLSDQRQGVTPPPVSDSTPRTLLEQHTYLDLDGDGYPEPYIVTVDQSSKKVLRIVARFAKVTTEQSVQIEKLRKQKVALGLQAQALQAQMQEMVASVPPPSGQQTERDLQAAQFIESQLAQLHQQLQALAAQAQQIDQNTAVLQQSDQTEPKVLAIEALEHYTKYGFIPSPDGGFYDLGLGALLGPVNDSVNTLINQLIDSGTLQNGSQGFIGKGARIQGGEVKFRPFEWKRVNVAGQTLRDSLVPLPINQPSNVLFQLLSLLITYGEKISSVNEAMSGNNPGQNTPAYNMQAMLEQGLQVFNGIFKRLYRSFRKELRKLYVLNRIYLNPIEYFETLDGNFQALQSDYMADERDVVPAADPNAFSNMQNVAKAQFLASRAATTPGYNAPMVERRLLEAMDIPDPQEVYPLDEQGQPTIPAPRNPEIDLQVAEEQRRTLESHSRMETQAALADSEIAYKEGMLLLAANKAQQDGVRIEIEKFDAITARIKANSDYVKKLADANKPKAA